MHMDCCSTNSYKLIQNAKEKTKENYCAFGHCVLWEIQWLQHVKNYRNFCKVWRSSQWCSLAFCSFLVQMIFFYKWRYYIQKSWQHVCSSTVLTIAAIDHVWNCEYLDLESVVLLLREQAAHARLENHDTLQTLLVELSRKEAAAMTL